MESLATNRLLAAVVTYCLSLCILRKSTPSDSQQSVETAAGTWRLVSLAEEESAPAPASWLQDAGAEAAQRPRKQVLKLELCLANPFQQSRAPSSTGPVGRKGSGGECTGCVAAGWAATRDRAPLPRALQDLPKWFPVSHPALPETA